MAKHPFPVFDADGHVLEDDGDMLLCFEGGNPWRERPPVLSN